VIKKYVWSSSSATPASSAGSMSALFETVRRPATTNAGRRRLPPRSARRRISRANACTSGPSARVPLTRASRKPASLLSMSGCTLRKSATNGLGSAGARLDRETRGGKSVERGFGLALGEALRAVYVTRGHDVRRA